MNLVREIASKKRHDVRSFRHWRRYVVTAEARVCESVSCDISRCVHNLAKELKILKSLNSQQILGRFNFLNLSVAPPGRIFWIGDQTYRCSSKIHFPEMICAFTDFKSV